MPLAAAKRQYGRVNGNIHTDGRLSHMYFDTHDSGPPLHAQRWPAKRKTDVSTV